MAGSGAQCRRGAGRATMRPMTDLTEIAPRFVEMAHQIVWANVATVDTKGRVWLSSSISRYDPMTGMRQSANVSTSGGIAQDLQGRIWAAGDGGVVWVDMETLAVGDEIALPVTNQVKGVSVDIDGYIWAVAQDDTRAFKIDPDTYDFEFYDGLNGPYTYSDMTGGAVFNVTCNPPEG